MNYSLGFDVPSIEVAGAPDRYYVEGQGMVQASDSLSFEPALILADKALPEQSIAKKSIPWVLIASAVGAYFYFKG